MHYNGIQADDIAVKVVELLIQTGHYKEYGSDCANQILRDIEELAVGLTDPVYQRDLKS
jgi:hypothetical protein